MTSPNQVIELMMKEAGIANLDMIVEEAYKLKEVGEKYYLDISGKVRETGMSRTILSSVVSLICCTSKRQEELLMFLSKAEETKRLFGKTVRCHSIQRPSTHFECSGDGQHRK
ncbi:MAG: hypothetical protein V3T40_04675 [Nitrososphaerales archaeon]